MLETVKDHLPEYAIEAWCLGTFMVSACLFGVLLNHPASPSSGLPESVRMVLMGVAMGSTAVAIICSPWGKRSGAHFNPAVTLTFLRLGKIGVVDAIGYVLAQFFGGVVGVLIAWALLGDLLADAPVNFVVTVPGPYGVGPAIAAEMLIAFLLMSMILTTTNSVRVSRLTPFLAGTLVAIYISVESPVSGMSMNPARTFASAAIAGNWTAWWIYFIAPPIAMLAAAEVFIRWRGKRPVLCGKLDHSGPARCIFDCKMDQLGKHPIEITKISEAVPD